MGRKGKVYFENGIIEDICFYYIHSDDYIEFYTNSGKYLFTNHLNMIWGRNIKQPNFYKSILAFDEYGFRKEDWKIAGIKSIKFMEEEQYV